MKNFYTFSLAIISCLSLSAQTWIKPGQAMNYEGKVVNLVGTILTLEMQYVRETPFILIKLIGSDSTQIVRVTLLSQTHPASPQELDSIYLSQYVQLKGKIYLYNGVPQIRLNNFKEISILRESEINKLEPK